MKGLSFTFVLAILLFSFRAKCQVPEKKSMALFHKSTATWCPPCGQWGWDLLEEIIGNPKFHGKGVFFALYASNTSNFYDSVASAFYRNFSIPSELPSFGVNGVALTTNSKYYILNEIETKAAKNPIASSASTSFITEDEVTVNCKVKFWEDASGDYYVSAYLIENGALSYQEGQSGIVPHRGVLRSSLSESYFGVPVANGSIVAGSTMDHTFRFPIDASGWDKSKLKVYTILWQKVGDKYVFVNIAEDSKATNIPSTSGIGIGTYTLYPNPSTHFTNLSFHSSVSGKGVLMIADLLGRPLLNQPVEVQMGQNSISFATQHLPARMYQVRLITQNGQWTSKLLVK